MSNPILNNDFGRADERVLSGAPMTINGTINKTFLLFACALVPAYYTWSQFLAGFMDKAMMLTTIGAIVGFIVALIVAFTKNKFFIPVYAVCEGLFLGGVSAMFEKQYPGIAFQAVSGTFAAMFSMLALYRLNLIKCTDKFRSVIFTATVSIAVLYLMQIIASFFHYSIPGIFESGMVGIGFSVLVVAIAALNLIIDFDFIEKGSQNMIPKDYEWYGAFGLMVTLVWLYIEILKLVAKLRDNNN